jgi:hypothetical protein
MLDDRSRSRSPAELIPRWIALNTLRSRALKLEREDAHPISIDHSTAANDDELPAIVVKAQEDARCQQALARVGYAKVRFEYVRHKRERRDTFLSLEPEFLWPTMDFVRDWLKAERKRIVTRLQWPFLATMSVTIVVVFAVWVLLASG